MSKIMSLPIAGEVTIIGHGGLFSIVEIDNVTVFPTMRKVVVECHNEEESFTLERDVNVKNYNRIKAMR